MILGYVKAFLIGAALCMIGQVLIDKTKLTPARILTLYVVTGVVLGAVGIYEPFAKWAGAGATVPLTGFGNLLAKGVHDAVAEKGVLRQRQDRSAQQEDCRGRRLRGHFLRSARGHVLQVQRQAII